MYYIISMYLQCEEIVYTVSVGEITSEKFEGKRKVRLNF